MCPEFFILASKSSVLDAQTVCRQPSCLPRLTSQFKKTLWKVLSFLCQILLFIADSPGGSVWLLPSSCSIYHLDQFPSYARHSGIQQRNGRSGFFTVLVFSGRSGA